MNATANGVKFLVGKKDILAEVAKWIIRQSPFIPENIEGILIKIKEKLATSEEFIKAEKENIGGYIEMEYWDLLKWLDSMFREIPEYVNLNLSKYERDKGIAVDDPSRPPFLATDRYSKVKEEHDFVDLDALIRNVCNGLEKK